jgi:predicted RND superfamily exporter protein
LRMFGVRAFWVDASRAHFLPAFRKVASIRFTRAFARLSLLLIPFALLGLSHTRFEQDSILTFPPQHPLRMSARSLLQSRGWNTVANLLFTAHLGEESNEKIISQVERLPLVTRVIDFHKIEDEISADIHEPKIKDLVKRESRTSSFFNRFESDTGESRAMVYLSSSNTAKVEALRESVAQICAKKECSLAGEVVAFAEVSQSFIKTLFESFIVSLVLVAAVIGFLVMARRSKKLFSLLIASFWGPFAMLAVILWGGAEINSVTCIVASTVVGLTGDNAIQFLFSSKRRSLLEGVEKVSGGSLQCTVVMMLIALVFLGSYFEPPRNLAFLLSFGFAASFIGDVLIFRALAD